MYWSLYRSRVSHAQVQFFTFDVYFGRQAFNATLPGRTVSIIMVKPLKCKEQYELVLIATLL